MKKPTDSQLIDLLAKHLLDIVKRLDTIESKLELSEEIYTILNDFINPKTDYEVITNNEQLLKELEGKTPNWDSDRIAQVDQVILKTAIAELLYFQNIPTKVTLNEYLEIAKDYSTPKSNNFINGVLDKLVREFIHEKRIIKTGRGLL